MLLKLRIKSSCVKYAMDPIIMRAGIKTIATTIMIVPIAFAVPKSFDSRIAIIDNTSPQISGRDSNDNEEKALSLKSVAISKKKTFSGMLITKTGMLAYTSEEKSPLKSDLPLNILPAALTRSVKM
ncbi:hypothetical protein YTPLAS73_10430 [Nitrosarchaeum sp.]|nr:hypothetical protein YTPLAS73_10430 [Nitrosarchaeum sp.]